MNPIKFLRSYCLSVSLLKKFLLAPALGLVLVLPFYIFAFYYMYSMQNSIQEFNKELIPLQEISYDNIFLLHKIVNETNNAVSAKEVEWLDNSQYDANSIRKNLQKFSNTTYSNEANDALVSFNEYYKKVKEVSIEIIKENYDYKNIDTDTRILVQRYNSINEQFNELKLKIKEHMESNVNSIYEKIKFLLFNGNLIFLSWFILSTMIIFFVHKDLKEKIKNIVIDSREIAKGNVDFKKRLNTIADDELGQVITSINIFIDKLHKSHQKLSTAKAKLKKLYITDRLTGVYNRAKIDETIENELKKAKRNNSIFSIIVIDIDYFKNINDGYGHLVGDSVLKEFSNRLKKNLREVDIIGRWGGEEFIVVCLEANIENTLLVAQNLRAKIEEHSFANVKSVTASFGVSTYSANDSLESIIERADRALYIAKESGRNRVCSI